MTKILAYRLKSFIVHLSVKQQTRNFMLTVFMITLVILAFVAIYNVYKPVTVIDYSVLAKPTKQAKISGIDVINMIIPMQASDILSAFNLNNNFQKVA